MATLGSRFSPDQPCRLCGGTVGSGSDGAHELCRARERRGLPTPCLGYRCPDCGGLGSREMHREGARGQSPVFFDPHSLARHCEARWPKCKRCGGTGSVEDL